MRTILCIDIGNTNIVFGLYGDGKMMAHWRIATDHERTADDYGVLLLDLFAHQGHQPEEVEGVAMASVVPPLTLTFTELSRRYLKQEALVIGVGVKTGVNIRYDNPREVGADRIANAVAAYRHYGGPCCVVDFGTATTFDAISREGDYLGGAIAPGIVIASEALFTRTAKLPRVELVRPRKVIGSNTTEAIQSGLIFGYVGLVEGIVSRFRQELGEDLKVVATGGLAEVIAKETEAIQTVDPFLTLEGIRLVYEMNQS